MTLKFPQFENVCWMREPRGRRGGRRVEWSNSNKQRKHSRFILWVILSLIPSDPNRREMIISRGECRSFLMTRLIELLRKNCFYKATRMMNFQWILPSLPLTLRSLGKPEVDENFYSEMCDYIVPMIRSG